LTTRLKVLKRSYQNPLFREYISKGLSISLLTIFTLFLSSQYVAAQQAPAKSKETLRKELLERILRAKKQKDWSMFLKDSSHTAAGTDVISLPLNLQWRFKTGGPIYSSPVVYDGKVVIASYDHKIYVLEAKSGKLLWDFQTGGEILSTPSVVDDTVYFGSKDGFVYALNLKDGKALWKFETDGKVLTSPVVVDDKVFFGSNDSYFYALNRSDGKGLWKKKLKDYKYTGIYSSPAHYKDNVYIASKNRQLIAFVSESGAREWALRTRNPFYSSPVIYNGILYISTFNGQHR
jgi:outer membrane protein assembly factor BamB